MIIYDIVFERTWNASRISKYGGILKHLRKKKKKKKLSSDYEMRPGM
jgi:hypothetical protein